jgi:hypothetical protein
MDDRIEAVVKDMLPLREIAHRHPVPAVATGPASQILPGLCDDILGFREQRRARDIQ